jgi:hypothetical protein
MLLIAPGAGAAASGVDITATEGQSFTGTVVNGLVCPLASATITWGDGTASTAGTSDGNMGIQGTHTYAEEGSYSGSVTYTYTVARPCSGATQTASFQATVQDAPLTGSGRNISGAAGQSLSAVVAHLGDANPSASAGDFSAQINWGDGTTTAGTVTAAAGGGFDVTGTHTYGAAGSFMVSTSIADSGGSTATATAQAAIAATTTTATTTTTTTTTAPPPSAPRIVRIDHVGVPAAGAPIVLTAVVTGRVIGIQWNLTGDSTPEITCAGAQTAVTFRAPAGTRSVTAVAVGAGGSRVAFAATVNVAAAAPLSAAQRRVAGAVSAALAKKAPVYACASPGDFKIISVGHSRIPSLVDTIQTRDCTTPRTVVEGNLQLVGCLRRITTFDEIPAAERGIIFPVAKSVGGPSGTS